ncbi:pyridine nucleotide-disulfide oxidoreductase family protein [Rhodovulum imhoffii]|uniref:Pyridine nucleotide-disulfide oxidoreductase family protein n=1 Tax=Rhodovulum imhoffii TaxID=365340 RepID=A0A2T5BSN5_9RHOB|nr:FAD-dependent oxidoreductase [Rhodovulum imhoffii]MBK5933057.1 pyridine nucleotide-disulfide oxidoreductase [Rhodovulum imhoffii]PTN02355.1 pyridine nucleotide-disulfide oxidoreductase family protein [Rhodovulum imhoffii]
MAQETAPIGLVGPKRLVLIGGGHAHALVLRDWTPLPGVSLTLLNPAPSAPYSGMLPGLIAGHYARTALEIDLAGLARRTGARLVEGRAEGIDRVARVIHVAGQEIPYDVASVDIGITTGLPLPGFEAHGVAAKPLDTFVSAWEKFTAHTAAGLMAPEVAVIGAGVAGVELALAADFRLRTYGLTPRIALLEAATPLRDAPDPVRRALLAELSRRDIALYPAAQTVTPDGVAVDGHAMIPAGFVLGVGGARPQGWLRQTGLHLTDGFITVGAQLQSSDPAIFAAGDCAHLSHAPRPKAGVYAVRAAPVLRHNLRAALSGEPLHPYRPQTDYLKLISLGDRRALAVRGRLWARGALMWQWKDRIDRSFMAGFSARA